MQHYRIYRLHPATGQITGGEDLHAPDDAAVLAEARLQGHDVSVEIWSGTRLVARLDAPQRGAAFA